MRLFNFYTTVHVDRFGDLALLTKGTTVIVEPISVGSDQTIEVCVRGEAATTIKLDQCIRRMPFLATAPVLEGSE